MLKQEAQCHHDGKLIGNGIEKLAKSRDLVSGTCQVAIKFVGERHQDKGGKDAHARQRDATATGNPNELGQKQPNGNQDHARAGHDVGGGPKTLVLRQD